MRKRTCQVERSEMEALAQVIPFPREIVLAHPTSASQVVDYRDCPRKWGFRKLDRVKGRKNRFASRGDDVHAVLEDWLRDGEPIPNTDAGKIARAGLKFLPSPRTGDVEQEFRFETIALFTGKKDWRRRKDHTARVLDHKSTSGFEWVKVAEDLREDPQAGMYGYHEMVEANHDLDLTIELDWVYYLANPKRPRALKVSLRVIPEGAPEPSRPDDVRPEHYGVMRHSELRDRFIDTEKTALVMLEHHAAGRHAMDLEYKLSACEKYGGCPYRGDPCKLKLSQQMRGHMEQEQNRMAQRMRDALAKRRAEKGAPTPSDGAKAPPAPPAASQASPEAKAAAAAPTVSTTPAASTKMPTAAQAQAAPPAVNPPNLDSVVSDAMPIETLTALVASRVASAVASRLPIVFGASADQFSEQVADTSVAIAKKILTKSGVK